MKLAQDGKIYIALSNYEYLGVIENPNEKGLACNFVLDGIYLEGKISKSGLQNIIPLEPYKPLQGLFILC